MTPFLIQGIWVNAEAGEHVTTYYRRTGIAKDVDEALPLLRGYVKERVPNVVVLYQGDHMVREWRKGQDYEPTWEEWDEGQKRMVKA